MVMKLEKLHVSRFAIALLVVLSLLACKYRKKSGGSPPASSISGAHPAGPASAAEAAPEATGESLGKEPDPVIDASRVSDKELCDGGRTSTALAGATSDGLLRAMRASLRSVRTVRVYGIAKMEIPSISSWWFDARASRELGAVLDADNGKGEKINIVQLPDRRTYAKGKFLFSGHRDHIADLGDRWFEVPAELLEAEPGEAHPDGPQGVFGMDIGYKAAIANFVQLATDWYPDNQAKWLAESMKGRSGDKPTSRESTQIEKDHRHFAHCKSVLIKSRMGWLRVSASDTPLPLQKDPAPGVIAGRFRWGEYNRPFPKAQAPKGAVSLATLVGR
jgi:hypothetical protein